MKKKDAKKDTRVMRSTNFDCWWKEGEMSRAIKPPVADRKGSYSDKIPQQGSLTCEKHGIFPNVLFNFGMWSGFPYYSLTIPSCNMPGHTTQLLCGQSALALC